VNDVIGSCPKCGGALDVRELDCSACGTRILGTFSQCDFCALTAEERRYVVDVMKEAAARHRGGGSDMLISLMEKLAPEAGKSSEPSGCSEALKDLPPVAERKKRRLDILRGLSRGPVSLKTRR